MISIKNLKASKKKKNESPEILQVIRKVEKRKNSILLPKLFRPTVRKHCSSDREKKLKFEAEGREFSKILRFP